MFDEECTMSRITKCWWVGLSVYTFLLVAGYLVGFYGSSARMLLQVAGIATILNVALTIIVYTTYRPATPTLHCLITEHIPGFHWQLVAISILQIGITAVLLQGWFLTTPDLWWQYAIVPPETSLFQFILLLFGYSSIHIISPWGEYLFLWLPRALLFLTLLFFFRQTCTGMFDLLVAFLWTLQRHPAEILPRLQAIGPRAAYWAGICLLFCRKPAKIEALFPFLGQSGNPNAATFLLKKLVWFRGQSLNQTEILLQEEIIQTLEQLASLCLHTSGNKVKKVGSTLQNISLAKLLLRTLNKSPAQPGDLFILRALSLVAPQNQPEVLKVLQPYWERITSLSLYGAVLDLWGKIALSDPGLLLQALEHANSEVCKEAARVLAKCRCRHAVKPIITLLNKTLPPAQSDVQSCFLTALDELIPQYLSHPGTPFYWANWLKSQQGADF